MAPRRSSSVCSLTAALVARNGAQSNRLRHRSMVVESRAVDRVVQLEAKRLVRVELAGPPDQQRGQIRPDAPVARLVRVRQGRAAARHCANPCHTACPRWRARVASMSRRLSRQVNCAKAMTRNCSAQVRLRTRCCHRTDPRCAQNSSRARTPSTARTASCLGSSGHSPRLGNGTVPVQLTSTFKSAPSQKRLQAAWMLASGFMGVRLTGQ